MRSKQLALYLSGRIPYYRDIVEGLGEALQHHPEWVLLRQDHDFFWEGPEVWRSGADAVVCGPLKDNEARERAAFRGRILCISNQRRETEVDTVVTDDREVGRVAARHLLGLGFRRLLMLRPAPSLYFSSERWEGFQEMADACPGAICLDVPMTEEDPDDLLRRIRKDVAVPFAMYCDMDTLAARITESAARLGLRIPEHMALLGTDNSRLLCQFSRPRLSSVELNGLRVGQCVGEALARGTGRRIKPLRVEITPLGVVARRSTDITAVEDPRLAKALTLLRARHGLGISVAELAKDCGMSRRLMELRFREHLGCSPHQEILRLRVARARELLAKTDEPIGRIAERCGFDEIRSFNATFLKGAGMSPRAWRARVRGTKA